MAELYKGKYRGNTIRANWWNYGESAGYFITFNTLNRDRDFGQINTRKMELSPPGEIVEQLWKEIPERFPYIRLDEFVVMPDHIHGILILQDSGRCAINRAPTINPPTINPPTINPPTINPPTINPSTTESPNPPKAGGVLGNHNPMLHDSISRAIRWFKGRATFEIRKINKDFAWQSRYYDRIIRNEAEFERIKTYIIRNPEQWQEK